MEGSDGRNELLATNKSPGIVGKFCVAAFPVNFEAVSSVPNMVVAAKHRFRLGVACEDERKSAGNRMLTSPRFEERRTEPLMSVSLDRSSSTDTGRDQ